MLTLAEKRERATEAVMRTDPRYLPLDLEPFRNLTMMGGTATYQWNRRKLAQASEAEFLVLTKWAKAYNLARLMCSYSGARAAQVANEQTRRLVDNMKRKHALS